MFKQFTFHSGYILIWCIYDFFNRLKKFTFHSGYILMIHGMISKEDIHNLHSTLVIFLSIILFGVKLALFPFTFHSGYILIGLHVRKAGIGHLFTFHSGYILIQTMKIKIFLISIYIPLWLYSYFMTTT